MSVFVRTQQEDVSEKSRISIIVIIEMFNLKEITTTTIESSDLWIDVFVYQIVPRSNQSYVDFELIRFENVWQFDWIKPSNLLVELWNFNGIFQCDIYNFNGQQNGVSLLLLLDFCMLDHSQFVNYDYAVLLVCSLKYCSVSYTRKRNVKGIISKRKNKRHTIKPKPKIPNRTEREINKNRYKHTHTHTIWQFHFRLKHNQLFISRQSYNRIWFCYWLFKISNFVCNFSVQNEFVYEIKAWKKMFRITKEWEQKNCGRKFRKLL